MNPEMKHALATNSNTALATVPSVPPAVRQFIESLKPRIAAILPKHMTPERMLRLVSGCMLATPKLATCTLESIATAVVTCSQLGLEPGGPLGQVYLIPYYDSKTGRTNCQLQIGYKGLTELARRSGQIRRLSASVFYQAEIDSGSFSACHEPPELHHGWTPGAWPDDEIAGAYAVAETIDGGRYQCVLSRAQIDARRARNPAVRSGRSSPWDTDYPAMARKTAIRALLSSGVVPLSAELATALEADAEPIANLDLDPEPPAPVRVEATVVSSPPPADVSDPPKRRGRPPGPRKQAQEPPQEAPGSTIDSAPREDTPHPEIDALSPVSEPPAKPAIPVSRRVSELADKLGLNASDRREVINRAGVSADTSAWVEADYPILDASCHAVYEDKFANA